MAQPIDDDTLQRLYDGDLSPLEARSVEARVATDPAAQRRLDELRWLGAALRETADELGAEAPSDAMFAAIQARIATPEKAALGERLRVLSSEWLTHRRGRLIPAVATAAVAAAALIAVLKPVSPPAESALRPDGQPGAVYAFAKGSQVENVDFGTSTGTVFEVDNEGVAAAVVWISDDEGEP
jgi:anti-sigma factor RsiW